MKRNEHVKATELFDKCSPTIKNCLVPLRQRRQQRRQRRQRLRFPVCVFLKGNIDTNTKCIFYDYNNSHTPLTSDGSDFPEA